MLYVALVRWSVFLFTLPIRFVAGEEGHLAAYKGSMTIVGGLGLLTFGAVVLAAVLGQS